MDGLIARCTYQGTAGDVIALQVTGNTALPSVPLWLEFHERPVNDDLINAEHLAFRRSVSVVAPTAGATHVRECVVAASLFSI